MKNRNIGIFIMSGLILSLLCVFASFKGKQEDAESRYITMRIYENFTVTSSKIIIIYADSTNEIIDLEPFKFNDEYLVQNNIIINKTLNKLRNSGYKIVTSTSNGKVTSSRNMLITTFILEK